MSERIRARGAEQPWDVVIIGGGASGIGCALDAAARGFECLLLEGRDFGKGTSSRSTKLVHGGVRYLEQGNLSLVREALRERGVLKKIAPEFVRVQSFIVPCYGFRQKIYYGLGLKIYDLLAGKYGFGKSRILSKKEIIEKLPNIERKNLSGGVSYFDGQFDDACFLMNLACEAAARGAVLLNYARVFGLPKDSGGEVTGVNFEDSESGEIFSVKAKIVINATGAFADEIRRMADPSAKDLIRPSQGVHLVFDEKFLPGEHALMIPKTSDERVLFLIPWLGGIVAGTTDTGIERVVSEPEPSPEEIEFILENCRNYLAEAPQMEDVKSVFTGIRPLVKSSFAAENTHRLARDHTIEIDKTRLLTLTGGKWTTYRRMAEDAVGAAIERANLPKRRCVTKNLKIRNEKPRRTAKLIEANARLGEKLHRDFPYTRADIADAARFEMARTVEDALARRTRILFLDKRAAIEVSRKAAEILAEELNKNEDWINEQTQEFEKLARTYSAAS